MNLSFLPEDMDWTCQPCGVKMVPQISELTYLSASFKVELPGCPKCGATLISEELALGKMFEVEQLLEDK